MAWLTEPLQFGFFRHGLIVATFAGALCGLVGVYVVLRGMSYIGHGLSHAIFGGAAASALTGTAGFPFGRGMKALSGTQTATLSVVFNAKSATSGIIQPGQSRAVTARLVQTPQGPLTLVLDEQ